MTRLLGQHVLPGFPYAQKYCPYCERELVIENTAHVGDYLEHYKAIMICTNTNCPYYDSPCREAYVRVFYSSEIAAQALQSVRLVFHRPSKGPIAEHEIDYTSLEGIEGVYFTDEEI